MTESLKASFDLPTMTDSEGDLPIELSVEFDPEIAGLAHNQGTIYLDFNQFYASNMQDAESEFKVAATATLTDAMSMESTYSFSIVIAPKGDYVPPVIEEPVVNETVEEEEEVVEGEDNNGPASKYGPTMLYLGLTAIIFVPIFKTVTHLPPYVGMMLSLAVVAAVAEFLSNRRFNVGKAMGDHDESHNSPLHKHNPWENGA